MPVYMNSGKIVAGGRDGTGGESKVLQEVLADLKTRLTLHVQRVQGRQQLFSTQCHSDDRAPSLLNMWMEIHWHHKNEIRSGGTR